MSVTDMRIQLGWFFHHKRRRLRKLLGGAGEAAIISLWAHCAANARDGMLGCIDDDTLAAISDWDGEGVTLRRALLACGLLEQCDDGSINIHDWAQHQPWAATSKERTESGRLNALARWHRDGKHTSPVVGCPLCASPATAEATKTTEEPIVSPPASLPPTKKRAKPRRQTTSEKKPKAVYTSADAALLEHYRERSGRKVRVLTARAQRMAAGLRKRGATEEDLRDAIDGMLKRPHRADDGTEYRELHHAWTDALFESHRARGEQARLGIPPADSVDSWESLKSSIIASAEAAEAVLNVV